MSYEDAFEALKDGDFSTAIPLLEKAARETRYTSDIINHAYTLALYQAGDKPRLAEVAFDVANSLSQTDPASAMDYFQRAIFAGLDEKRIRHIGGLFEGWGAPGRATDVPLPRVPINRVAHVVGCVFPDNPITQYLKLLAASLRKQGIESSIFTTEWAASWFFNPVGAPQSQHMELDAEVNVASVEGDFEERAARIAETLRASGIAVAFFHADLSEQITARVASLRPVAVQINVNHGSEMEADLFEGRVHLFENAVQCARFAGAAQWIPPVSDIETKLHMTEPITRQSIGLESASSVSATFGNLQLVGGREYLQVLTEIMNRFPKHFHLFAGAGSVKAMRSHLHSEGVLPRVRFLGQLTDVAPLLETIDVYLASFPNSEANAILEVMGAGKPVVAMRFPPDSRSNTAAEFVGNRELTAARAADYIDIADQLLRNSSLRAKQGQAMLERFRAEFRPERLGERYKAFLANPQWSGV